MPGMMLVALVIVGAMIWLVVYLANQSAGMQQKVDGRERVELERLRNLVDDLKETAWDHRELDSALATIIIDKIRSHERRGRELGP
ncbi:MAG: hypothetical protein ACJ72A_08250 [Nocardioidaceae bacterium]|jgi:hypothetical protein